MIVTAFKKTRSEGCCGTVKTSYELSFPLRKEYVQIFSDAGFFVSKPFETAGLLYIEHDRFTANGTFGRNILKIECKVSKCEERLIELEVILNGIYDQIQKANK